MSILIRGIQMPSECRKCFSMEYGTMTGETYCKVNGKTLAESYRPIEFDGRPDWCPMVELPENHGRLMDADAFLERFLSVDRTVSFGMTGLYVDIHDIYNILISLPTVIEAEDGTCTM